MALETRALLSLRSSLLSLKVVSSSVVVIPVGLNGSRKSVEVQLMENFLK